MTQPIVGVLGGMGPEATVELMRRVIRATPAQGDADHIRMIVDNNPKVPSRITAILNGGENPGPVLAGMARGLEVAGANFLVMPCNSAHYFLPAIKAAVSIPMIDMIALTITQLRAKAPSARTVGILCTDATRRTKLFDAGCGKVSVKPVYCATEAEASLLEVICMVKAGRLDDIVRGEHLCCANSLIAAGADAIIVACTELSALGGLEKFPVPVIDTMDTLVEEIILRCGLSADFGHDRIAEA